MGNQRKNFLVYLGVISVIIAGFFILFDGNIGSTEEIPMSSVISLTENPPIGQRVNILVKGDELEIISGNQTYTSRKEPGSSIYKILQDAEINCAAEMNSAADWLATDWLRQNRLPKPQQTSSDRRPNRQWVRSNTQSVPQMLSYVQYFVGSEKQGPS